MFDYTTLPTAYVPEQRYCDIHKAGIPSQGLEPNTKVPAVVDGPTWMGPHAFLCVECFEHFGMGSGQHLVIGQRPRPTTTGLDAIIRSGATMSQIEDYIGDGDIADYL